MSEQTDDRCDAVAGQVERPVRPCAWAHRYSPRGLLHTLRDNQQDAEDDASIVGGSAHVVPLYDEAALEAAVAAERERCAKLCDEQRSPGHSAWGDGYDEGAADCAAAIRGPNAKLTRPAPSQAVPHCLMARVE